MAVDDAAAYRTLIANQPAIGEESAVDEIASYKEVVDDKSTSFFLATPSGNRLALCGLSAPAVRRARDIYLDAGADGVLADRPGQVTIQIYPRRLIASHRSRLSQQMAALRLDFLSALVGPAASGDHSLGRGVAYWLDGLLACGEQVDLIEINAALDADKISASCIATLTPGRLAEILEDMAGKPLILRHFDPGDCAAWQNMALGSSLLRALAEAAAECLLLATEGMAGQNLREKARALLAEAESAGPLEMLSVDMAKAGDIPPATFRIIRWQQPERVPALIESFDRLMADGGEAAKFFAARGLALKWRRAVEAYRAAGESADVAILSVNPLPVFATSLASRRAAQTREILLGCRGAYLIAAGGDGARQRWPQIMTALDQLNNAQAKGGMQAKDASGIFCLGELWPMRYVQIALDAVDAAVPSAPKEVTANSVEAPFNSEWRYSGGKVICRLRLPRRTVYALARLCLGMPSPAD